MEIIPIQNVNLNIEDMVDRIFVGPQGDLLRDINSFNECFAQGEECIKITKKWRFKPGVYANIKKHYNLYVNQFGMKPRGLYSLRDRISQSTWKGRTFWDNALAIEQSLWNFRENQHRWLDNTDLVRETWETKKAEIIPAVDAFNDKNPQYNLKVGLDEAIMDDKNYWNRLKVYTTMDINDISITVHYGKDVGAIIPWGDMELRWEADLWIMLNDLCDPGNTNRRHNHSRSPSVQMHPLYVGAMHPYVSSRNNPFNNVVVPEFWIPNVCAGDHDSPLRAAYKDSDYDAMAFIAKRWLSNYHIPNTNPLNRITRCFYGFPLESNVKFLLSGRRENAVFDPKNEMLSCNWIDKVASIRNYEIDKRGVLIQEPNQVVHEPGMELNHPCHNCQFQNSYSYAFDDGNIKDYEPCSAYQRFEYRDPVTEDDCISEACILLFMCRDIVNDSQYNGYLTTGSSNVGGWTWEALAWPNQDGVKNLLQDDICLENILELNPDIYLPFFWTRTTGRISTNADDLLDRVFMGNMWTELFDEWTNLNFGEMNDDNYEEVQDFREQNGEMDIPSLRIAIEEAKKNPCGLTVEEQAAMQNSQTPEERVIAWAASHGSAINIGESR